MKKISLLFCYIIVIVLFSCKKDEVSHEQYNKVVLLYMAANNNLSPHALNNIQELKQGYVPSKDSKEVLLVYLHSVNSSPRLFRLYSSDNTIKEINIESYDNHNSASADVLNKILNRVKSSFKSKEYGLILWSHATGWLPQGYYNGSQIKYAFFEDPYSSLVKSFGEDRGVEMEITELKKAISYKLSFIIFDCCYMGGIETIYELRDRAEYIMASPTEILATGFPYNRIMDDLFKSSSNLVGVGDSFFNYYNSMSGVNRSATLALYNTSEMHELSTITRSIIENNRHKISTLEMSSIQQYFRYNKRWFWDLEDFIHKIASDSEYILFKQSLSKVVTHKWNTDSFIDIPILRFSGVSTYIPFSPNPFIDSFYKSLEWNRDVLLIK